MHGLISFDLNSKRLNPRVGSVGGQALIPDDYSWERLQ